MADPRPGNSDAVYMELALGEALRGLGHTSPNPPVGCVLVRNGSVIGRGYHAAAGELHAEAAAIRDAGDARGATCYVTLEPCSHVGRQPACTTTLIEAGVRDVVYGVMDADPRSCGKANALLRAAGVTVRSGVLEQRCTRLLDWYIHSRRLGTAFLHLKMALSLDGKLATRSGSSQWLSGPESLGYAHFLRQKYDAVLVGIGTVRADNPRLTVRAESLDAYVAEAPFALRNPVRIVLDPRFELAGRLEGLELGELADHRPDLPGIVLAGDAQLLPAVSSSDPRMVYLGLPREQDGALSFGELARQLPGLGIHGVLIEGGSGVATALLRQRAAHRLTCVYTPQLIGSDGLGFTPEWQLDQLVDGPRLQDVEIEPLGSDCAISGSPVWPAAGAK